MVKPATSTRTWIPGGINPVAIAAIVQRVKTQYSEAQLEAKNKKTTSELKISNKPLPVDTFRFSCSPIAKVIIELSPASIRKASCKTCEGKIDGFTYRIKASGYHHASCYLGRQNIMKCLPNIHLSSEKLDDTAKKALGDWLGSAKDSLKPEVKSAGSEKENEGGGSDLKGKRKAEHSGSELGISINAKKRKIANEDEDTQSTNLFGLPIPTVTISDASTSESDTKVPLPIFPAPLEDLFKALTKRPKHFSGRSALTMARSL